MEALDIRPERLLCPEEAHEGAQHRAALGLALRCETVINPRALAAGLDHPGRPKHSEVPRRVGLVQPQGFLEVANAELAVAEQRHDPQPRLISKGAQEPRHGTYGEGLG
jgi:hypothetical protein